MRKLAALVVTLVVLLAAPMSVASAQSSELTIEVVPREVSLDLGETISIDVIVTNSGEASISGVVAHIDMTDLSGGGSVDPEDWSKTLSRTVSSLGPGESATVQWDLQPISPGTFTLYAVALVADRSAVAASETLTIAVADRRSLNPEGILPFAIAAPVVVGVLLLIQMRRNRSTARGRQQQPAPIQ